jgi:hypothetical protein
MATEHFHNLAQPSDDPDFDTRFKQQCQQDYITIKSIYNKIIPKVVTMDELKEAIYSAEVGSCYEF